MKELVKDAIYGAAVSSCSDCEVNPCQNGGNCILGVQGYMCQCSQYYTGKNCSQSLGIIAISSC